MAENPKVFISYSHDTPEHKQWVSELAAKLRRNGVEAILDQWYLDLNQDLTQFAESGIRAADRVLVICTDSYVRKANDGEDGVGYEPMIVTKKLVEDHGTNKFIPIIRQTEWEDKIPTFLEDRIYVDFTNDEKFDAKFDELLHERPLGTVPYRDLMFHILSHCMRKNYRALRDVELKQLKPLSVFLGANSSGKSTLFDVFAFLAECFTDGLRRAWDKRGRFKELRSRGCDGQIEFELKYREEPKSPIITYHLSIDEDIKGPFVDTEWLQWRPSSRGKHIRFLDFHRGVGSVIAGETPDEENEQINEQLDDPSGLAVNMFGQLTRHPRVSALRRFITDWHLSYLSTDATRQATDDGPQKRLSATGDNLPNVIQYLQERYPERLEKKLSLFCRIGCPV